MQKRQGYCSYCRVQYNNLEQTLTKGKTKKEFFRQKENDSRWKLRDTGSNEEQWKAFVQCSAQEFDQTE
ncbi:zinc finger DBF-type containing 2 [Homo sapiens]|uniref:Zinc finger DBF-type containing 2 n=1 Tax=Homo sapiens TaxID=9606 RepID=A0A3B3ITX6_HUMAN|nr:zinc finger DBF-type containing 2 [Homo sapiens]KAI4037800.1 zinc finger DBF-type containing 2 [Homo sapiens]